MRAISKAAQYKGLCLIKLCINFIIDAPCSQTNDSNSTELIVVCIESLIFFFSSNFLDITEFTKDLKDAISPVPSIFHYHNSQHIKRRMKFP